MAPLCVEKKHFSQLEQRLGLWDRLMMNSAFIILLTHWNTVWLQHLWFWQFVLLFFFLFWEDWGRRGGRDRSNKRKKSERGGWVITRSIPLRMPRDECMAQCCWACWGSAFINHQLLCFGHDTEGRGELIWLLPYFWKTAVTDSLGEKSL